MIDPADARLFRVVVKRTYTDAYREKWPGPTSTESEHLAWGESSEAVDDEWTRRTDWTRHAVNARTTWEDAVVRVSELDVVEERAKCRERYERAFARTSRGSEYAPCCDLAVLRPCVCAISYSCPDHGVTCHGTHD